jgi:hypothetical protein
MGTGRRGEWGGKPDICTTPRLWKNKIKIQKEK